MLSEASSQCGKCWGTNRGKAAFPGPCPVSLDQTLVYGCRSCAAPLGLRNMRDAFSLVHHVTATSVEHIWDSFRGRTSESEADVYWDGDENCFDFDL